MLNRMWGKGNASALLVGMQAGTAPLDVSVVISQKIRKQSSSRPSHTTFGYISKGCSIMFIAALFVIARTWKQPKCSLTKEWIRKMWYIYTMEYYTAEKNNDILNFAGKWMELKKQHFEWGNPDTERQLSHVLTHRWFLNIKQRKPVTNHNTRELRQQWEL